MAERENKLVVQPAVYIYLKNKSVCHILKSSKPGKGHSSTLETELSDPARSSLGLESNQLFSSNQACTFPGEYQ